MRIVLKPMGVMTLLFAMVVLTALAFRPSVAALGSSRAAAATAPRASVIYDGTLRGDISLPPWAKQVDLSSADPDGAPNGTVIRARLQGYDGIRFHLAKPMDTSSYDRLLIGVHGGEQGLQELHVQALLSGAKTDQRVLLDKLPAARWVYAVVPLAQLHADGKADLTDFWVQDTSGKMQPDTYLKDIRFLRPGDPAPADTLGTTAAPRANW